MMSVGNVERLCITVLSIAACAYRPDCITGIFVGWFIIMCLIGTGENND